MSELPKIDKKRTGETLKSLMKKRKYNAFTLSRDLGLGSTTNVYKWTQGAILPNADSLVKLAYLLKCDINDIIVLEGKEDA